MMSCSDSKIEQNGREAAVLADRRDLVAAAGEDLVRVGLVADVPEDLVLRRVEQRVQRDGDLAGAEVGAEVAADLPHRVDQQLADLLGDLLELVVGEPVQVGGAVDAVEDAGHEGRVKMKSVMCSSSVGAARGGLRQRVARVAVRFGGHVARPVESVLGHVGHLPVPLVAALRLPQGVVRAGHVEDVVDDLEEHAQLRSEVAEVRQCRGFVFARREEQYALDGGADQPPGLELVQPAERRGA